MSLQRELTVVRPGDPRYAALRSTYTTVGSPAAVYLPESTEEVAAALRTARDSGLPIAVRSGGHGIARPDAYGGGAVIDLSTMDEVELLGGNLVRIQAGARWANVALTLAPLGLAISAGDHGNVGVGGLVTGGGVGWMARRDGLTIDRVRAVEVVLADGTAVRATAEHEPDLFWLVRGAGAGAGIVTAVEIEAAEVTDVGIVQLAVICDDDGEALCGWANYLAQARRELTSAATLLTRGTRTILAITCVVADPDRMDATLPLRELGPILQHRTEVVPYPALVPPDHLHPNVGQQPNTTTNGLLTEMTDATARAVLTTGMHALVQLRSLGGAINDVAPDATAYAHRHQQTMVVAATFPPGTALDLDAAWLGLGPRLDGAYVNFETRPAGAFDRIYPGATGRRVAELRHRYDPERVFNA